jgi:hypothetical protein
LDGEFIFPRVIGYEKVLVLGWTREVEGLLQSMQLVVGLWLQRGPADGPLSTATSIRVKRRSPFRLVAASTDPGGMYAQPRVIVKERESEDPSTLQISEVSPLGLDVAGHSRDVLPTVSTIGAKAPIPSVPETGQKVGTVVERLRPTTDIQPKLGTTAELAAQNIDHRAGVDQ